MKDKITPMPVLRHLDFSVFYYTAVYQNEKCNTMGDACSILLTGWESGTTNGISSKEASNFSHGTHALSKDRILKKLLQISPEEDDLSIEDEESRRDNLQARLRKVLQSPLNAANRINLVKNKISIPLEPREEMQLSAKFTSLQEVQQLNDDQITQNYAISYLAAAFAIAVKYSSGNYIAKEKGQWIDRLAGNQMFSPSPVASLRSIPYHLDEYLKKEAADSSKSRKAFTISDFSRSDLWKAGKQHWVDHKPIMQGIIFAADGKPLEILPLFVSPREGDNSPVLLTDALIHAQKKHCFLLGQGGAGKTTALLGISDQLYTENKSCPYGKSIPFYLDLSTAPDIGGALYHEGKSSFIRRSLYRALFGEDNLPPQPKGEPLSPVFTADERLILHRITPLLRQSNSSPSLMLLLDGINEISRTVPHGEEMSPIAVMVQKEIALLTEQYPNVQIILAGRVDDRIINGDNIVRFDLCGLEDDVICDCVAKHISTDRADAVRNNPTLLNTLRLPLFLAIYIRLKASHNANTQGELLQIFFGEHKTDNDIYTTRSRNRQIERNLKQIAPGQEGRLTAEQQAFIIDFILPEIAWRMGAGIWIHGSSIEQAISDILSDRSETAIRGHAGTAAFLQYQDPYNLEKHTDHTAQELEEFGMSNGRLNWRKLTDKIITYCLFTLGILQRDGGNYRFSHQVFRDYFAASKIINTFRIAAEEWQSAERQWGEEKAQRQQAAFDCLCDVLGKTTLDVTLRRMIGEILGEYRNVPDFQNGRWAFPNNTTDGGSTLCGQMLEICRGQHGAEAGCVVQNLIRIMRESRHGDLSGLDFSRLDLRRCSLNGARLSHPGLTTRFRDAWIARDTLFPTGHTSLITSIAFHPDPAAHMLITASCDETAKLWDMHAGDCVGTLRGHQATVTSAAFNPRDPRYAVTGCFDGSVKIWDCQTLACMRTLQIYNSPCTCAAYSPDGTLLATGAYDGTITLWEQNTDMEYTAAEPLCGNPFDIAQIQFHPTEDEFLTLHRRDGCLRIWHRTADGWDYTETTADQLGLHGMNSAMYRPDGKRILVSTLHPSTFLELDADTLEPLPDSRTEDEENLFALAVYTPDSSKIVSVGTSLVVRNADDSSELLRVSRSPDLSICLPVISPDGNWIVFDREASVEIRDIASGTLYTVLNGYWRSISSAAYHPSGQQFVMSGRDGAASIWSVSDLEDSHQPFCKRTALLLQDEAVKHAEFHPDACTAQLLTVSRGGDALLWDIPTEECLASFKDDHIEHAAFSRKGDYMLLSSDAFFSIGFALWDPDSGGLSQSTYRTSFAMEGQIPLRNREKKEIMGTRYLTISGDRDDLCFWRPDISCPAHHHRPQNDSHFSSATFSHNGRLTLAGQDDGLLLLYDATLKHLLCAKDSGKRIIGVCFSPDDTRAAVAGMDSIQLWDIQADKLSPNPTPCYQNEKDDIQSIAYSPNGHHILVALSNDTCQILDADTLACLHVIPHITGLFVQGIDLSRLAGSDLAPEDRDILRLYGADIG